jgi:hypothetical protein
MAKTNASHVNLSAQKLTKKPAEVAEQLRRRPEIQAEVERIGQANIYLELDRDLELFDWLDDQRDAKLCGYIVSAYGSGLSKACQLYRIKYVKRRGALLEIPAPVMYVNIHQHGSPTDLHRSLLEEFGHPLTHLGKLRELRTRCWATLKAYGVKLLIIDQAELLTLEAINELIDIFNQLKIPVILAGTYSLLETFTRSSLRYLQVHDAFLEFHEFPNLTKEDIKEVVEHWENTFLTDSQRLNLVDNLGVIDFLSMKSQGILEAVYDLLRKIAILKLDEPAFELSLDNLLRRFGQRIQPKGKPYIGRG